MEITRRMEDPGPGATAGLKRVEREERLYLRVMSASNEGCIINKQPPMKDKDQRMGCHGDNGSHDADLTEPSGLRKRHAPSSRI
jgi:hypothetical protein